jgi:hypothetical protein
MLKTLHLFVRSMGPLGKDAGRVYYGLKAVPSGLWIEDPRARLSSQVMGLA